VNSRERFLAALRGETPDRTPVAHVSALTTVELQEMTGCYMPGVHLDAGRLARLCWANHEVLGFDAVTFNINYFGEPAALGAKMNWGTATVYPNYESHPWSAPEDATIPEDLLDREPIRTYLETIRIAKRGYGDRVAVLGKIMGPFSMTQVMHGIEKVMMGMIDEPEAIAHYLEVSAQVLARCANAQFEAGIDALAIGEGGAGGNMLSPRMHESFLVGVHRGMMEAIQGPTIMHICGDITPRLDSLSKVGLTCFNFDWAIAPKVMKESSAGAFRIMGNVNTTDLMLASPEEIKAQVIENLEAGVDIISPGCATSPKCPNANFQAMVEAVGEWHGGRG